MWIHLVASLLLLLTESHPWAHSELIHSGPCNPIIPCLEHEVSGHPGDCSLYYQCVHGQYRNRSCPESHTFDVVTGQCGPGATNCQPACTLAATPNQTPAPCPADELDCEVGTKYPDANHCHIYFTCNPDKEMIQPESCMDRLVFDFWTQSCVDQTVPVTVDCSATCAYRRTTASGYDVTGNEGGVSPSSHNPPGNLTVSSLPITNQNAPHKHTDDPTGPCHEHIIECMEQHTTMRKFPDQTNCRTFYECVNGTLWGPCCCEDDKLFDADDFYCADESLVDCDAQRCSSEDSYPKPTSMVPMCLNPDNQCSIMDTTHSSTTSTVTSSQSTPTGHSTSSHTVESSKDTTSTSDTSSSVPQNSSSSSEGTSKTSESTSEDPGVHTESPITSSPPPWTSTAEPDTTTTQCNCGNNTEDSTSWPVILTLVFLSISAVALSVIAVGIILHYVRPHNPLRMVQRDTNFNWESVIGMTPMSSDPLVASTPQITPERPRNRPRPPGSRPGLPVAFLAAGMAGAGAPELRPPTFFTSSVAGRSLGGSTVVWNPAFEEDEDTVLDFSDEEEEGEGHLVANGRILSAGGAGMEPADGGDTTPSRSRSVTNQDESSHYSLPSFF